MSDEELRGSQGVAEPAEYLAGPMGMLYFDPSADGDERVLVREFDETYSPELVAAYADLIRAVNRWVRSHAAVARWVSIEEPVEVGADYLTRPYPMYYNSTGTYDDTPETPDPPSELETMRSAVAAAQAQDDLSRDGAQVISRVVTKSLLEPTGRTYFNDLDDRFIVVEPKIDRADVLKWAAIGDAAQAVYRAR